MKLSKLADYALVILAEMPDGLISARVLSEKTHLPLATTNKILKALTKNGICGSKGGKTGGFYLSKNKNGISIFDVMVAIDGRPPIFTHCTSGIDCQIVAHCKIQKNSSVINDAISNVLQQTYVSNLL